jgi:hypothetical protein
MTKAEGMPELPEAFPTRVLAAIALSLEIGIAGRSPRTILSYPGAAVAPESFPQYVWEGAVCRSKVTVPADAELVANAPSPVKEDTPKEDKGTQFELCGV